MSEEQTVTYELEGEIALVGLNRPDKRNCFNPTVMKQLRNYSSVSHVPLSSNPFKMAAEAGHEPTPADDTREKKQREEEKAAIAKAVAGLQLQFVMHGDKNKSCMINNTLYREGQQIDSFTIEKISPNTVIVRNGIYRFQLSMQGK